MFFFFFIHALIFIYLLVRVVLPLSARLPAKAALAAVFLVVSQHNLVRRLFGQMASPEMSGPFIIVEGFCFAALLFFFFLVLADDITALGRRAVKAVRVARTTRSGAGGRVASSLSDRSPGFSPGRRKALLAVAAAIPAAWGVREAVIVPGVNRMEERSARIPRELDGLVIVHIADLHVSPLFDERWTSALVERINGLTADLVFITGDLVDGTPGTRARAIAPLTALKARYGVFGCMGNHEYYGDFRGWKKAFPKLGITMLENRHETLTLRGRQVVVAGVTDQVATGFGLPGPDARGALAGAPEGALRLMLAHRPALAANNAGAGADMQFSGHTHGGQILGMNRVVARFNEGFVYGWYGVAGMRMYVSSGAGLWNGFPVRLGVPSEIARIVLRSA